MIKAETVLAEYHTNLDLRHSVQKLRDENDVAYLELIRDCVEHIFDERPPIDSYINAWATFWEDVPLVRVNLVFMFMNALCRHHIRDEDGDSVRGPTIQYLMDLTKALGLFPSYATKMHDTCALDEASTRGWAVGENILSGYPRSREERGRGN